jgi:fused signal recognition particle receptor
VINIFGFLKKKLKGALDKFSKDVEEEVEIEEVKETIIEEKPKAEKKDKPKKEKPVKEKAVPKKKEPKEIKEDSVSKEEIQPVKKEPIDIPKEDKVETITEEVKEESLPKEEKEIIEEPISKEDEIEPIKEEETIAEEDLEPVKEEPKEKKGFFKKLFKKKEKLEEKPEVKEEIKETEKKGIFTKITETVTKKAISDKKFEELFFDLEVGLLESNVAVEVIEKIKEDLKKELVDTKVLRGTIQEVVENTLKNSLSEILEIKPIDILEKIKTKKPYVICFIGVNGSGKTTTIAKFVNLLKANNLKCVLAAADTFRAAAIQQLEEHANNLNVKMIKHDYGSDPAAVAFDAIKYAEQKALDVVLIDTAGRLHSNANLMAELDKIIRIAKPDFKIFVGESITGNDCVFQATEYNKITGIDGIILSKADVDDKGGAAISVSYVTKKPILFMGTGQEYKDLEVFDKDKILNSLGL